MSRKRRLLRCAWYEQKSFVVALFLTSALCVGCSSNDAQQPPTSVTNEAIETVANKADGSSPQNNALLSFGFTATEYHEDFANFATFSDIITSEYLLRDKTVAFLAYSQKNEQVSIVLLTDSDGKVCNISIGNVDTEIFADVAKSAISATDMRLNYDELNSSLNFENAPSTIDDFRLFVTDGISLSYSSTGLRIQRDFDTKNEYAYMEIHSSPSAQIIPAEYISALNKAMSYSSAMHMSKAGIYDQLTSEYGERFAAEAAQYAIDNMQVNWEVNALEKAKSYNSSMHMSKKGIYDQLISEYGEQFTPEEAQYAVDNIQVDWKINALKKAKNYHGLMNMSPAAIHDQLTSEYGEQFTSEEADYAIANLN